jgi:hypothetical protein
VEHHVRRWQWCRFLQCAHTGEYFSVLWNGALREVLERLTSFNRVGVEGHLVVSAVLKDLPDLIREHSGVGRIAYAGADRLHLAPHGRRIPPRSRQDEKVLPEDWRIQATRKRLKGSVKLSEAPDAHGSIEQQAGRSHDTSTSWPSTCASGQHAVSGLKRFK